MQASQSTPKDPRIIAREYQKKLCKIALEENTIVYLETGCGKTHIAVLLMYELRHLIRKPSKSICVFLAPTNALVQQQAAVIEHSTDFKVGRYYGNYGNFTSHHDWEEEIQKYEIFVMTPERLLRNLHHCLMRMEFIALLIFDECHNAHKGHPYAQIMKEFYKANTGKNPRIFGMTASPIVGKGGSSQTNYSKSINTLEHLLDAKVHSVEDKEELESLIASPNIKLYYYNPNVDNTCSSFLTCGQKLWQLKDKYLLLLRGNSEEPKELQKKAKLLAKLHKNLMFCLDDIGLWGAAQDLKMRKTIGGGRENNGLYLFNTGCTSTALSTESRSHEQVLLCYTRLGHMSMKSLKLLFPDKFVSFNVPTM